MLLDKSLMENNKLSTSLNEGGILEVVNETIEILKGQAVLKNI
jgi:hypothetical protein